MKNFGEISGNTGPFQEYDCTHNKFVGKESFAYICAISENFMKANTHNMEITTIDEYIATFEPAVRKTLNEIRALIRNEAPEATEKIAYRIPTFYLNGNLVHFAAFKTHYSFFPTSSGIDAFGEELAPYRTGRGTLQFPADKPLPWDMIQKIVRFRVRENLDRTKKKKTKMNKST
jgi:uncharacterized protein YdhG (YjbR/CyaY superfamily)